MLFGNRKLAREADRLRADFVGAVDRGDADSALRIAAERLLPVAEELAGQGAGHLVPAALILRDVAAGCGRLGRPIGQFYSAQRSFDVAMLARARGRAIPAELGDSGTSVAALATELAGRGSPGRGGLSAADERLLLPAAALVPRSIELMGDLNAFPSACRMRLAATKLRLLSYRDLAVVDCESRAMVWLARLGLDRGDPKFATAEVGEALHLWIDQLGSTSRYWSPELLETWTVAVRVLDGAGRRPAAAALRGAIRQATGGFAAADMRPHYRAAMAAL